MSDVQIQGVWVELIEFQHRQVGIKVVGVVFSLLLNVFFKEWKVIGVVAEKLVELQVISIIDEKLVTFTHRSILFSISGIVIVPSEVSIVFDMVAGEIVSRTEREFIFLRQQELFC